MKTTITILLMALTTSASFAQSQMYLVEPMLCTGRLTSNNPGMHPSYKDHVYKYEFNSFKSTRRDGSLADSLEVQTDMTSNYYLSPLYVDRKGVIEKSLGGYDETLRLQIVSSRLNNDGSRTDKLVGTIGAQGTVVGNTSYKLNCTARVVKKVKRVDNFTNRR